MWLSSLEGGFFSILRCHALWVILIRDHQVFWWDNTLNIFWSVFFIFLNIWILSNISDLDCSCSRARRSTDRAIIGIIFLRREEILIICTIKTTSIVIIIRELVSINENVFLSINRLPIFKGFWNSKVRFSIFSIVKRA